MDSHVPYWEEGKSCENSTVIEIAETLVLQRALKLLNITDRQTDIHMYITQTVIQPV